ncbi:MAG: divalent-cation tolerance protein CutA [Deltaproteobacteria bacterium]|nr:divalent-cation tolerance protein CutA [Deltaproteobacteria bacterium]
MPRFFTLGRFFFRFSAFWFVVFRLVLVAVTAVFAVRFRPAAQAFDLQPFTRRRQEAEEQECLLILKSRTEVYDALEAAVKAHHSYDVPEIVALPILQGSAEYLSWIREMTKEHIR